MNNNVEAQMNSRQTGFTLIELVVVIVILGILAASALPRFVDLTDDANQAAVEGFAGAINGGNNINYATFLASQTLTDARVVTTAADGCVLAVANELLQEDMPAGYDVTAGPATVANGANITCTLEHTPSSSTADFTLTGATGGIDPTP